MSRVSQVMTDPASSALTEPETSAVIETETSVTKNLKKPLAMDLNFC